MQTGTKKTPDRFQNYFCPAAANDIVHHAYAWIVKEPNMQPKFLYCRAIDDPANDRGWNIIAEVWERDALGGWGISSSTMHPEFEDTSDGYVLAESMPGTAASLPYQVFREVVNEHDTNYLIALAIAIDALPKHRYRRAPQERPSRPSRPRCQKGVLYRVACAHRRQCARLRTG